MTYYFETKLENTLKNNFNFTQIENLKIKYIISILISETSKLILMALFFKSLGYIYDFMLLTLSLLLFRPQIGGLHFKSYIKCFSFTLTFSLIIIILKNFLPLTTKSIILLGIFSLINIFLFAPLISKQKRAHIKSRSSWKITLLALLHIAILVIFPQNSYLEITIWALFLQSIQLIIGRGGEIYETLYSKNTYTN